MSDGRWQPPDGWPEGAEPTASGDEPPPPPPPHVPDALLSPPSAAEHSGDPQWPAWLPPPTTPPPPPRRNNRAAFIVGVAVLTMGIAAGAIVANDGSGPEPFVPSGEPVLLVEDDVARAMDAAGCSLFVDEDPLEDRSHVDIADAPPADVLYGTERRPNHSGQHFAQWQPEQARPSRVPLDERSVTHNLEHGAVVVWFEDDAAPPAADEIATWLQARQDLGFRSASGGGLFASPYLDISSGGTVALRAWGVAIDCERWDPRVADAFLIEHYGDRGIAPEASISPYPDGQLEYDVRTRT